MAKAKATTDPKAPIKVVLPSKYSGVASRYHLRIEADIIDTDIDAVSPTNVKVLATAFIDWCTDGDMLLEGELTVEVTPK